MSHLTKEQIDIFVDCIEKCEKAIDNCQTLVTSCILRNEEECAQHVGICVKACSDNIQSCHECIKFCDAHMRNCNDETCKDICNYTITVLKKCIEASTACISKCKMNEIECINEANECIKESNHCAKACQNFIDFMKLKK